MTTAIPIGAVSPHLARFIAEGRLSDPGVYAATRSALRSLGYDLQICLTRSRDGHVLGPWYAKAFVAIMEDP